MKQSVVIATRVSLTRDIQDEYVHIYTYINTFMGVPDVYFPVIRNHLNLVEH